MKISRDFAAEQGFLRVIKMNLVKICLKMLAETSNEFDDYKKSSEQFGWCLMQFD